MMAPPTSSAVYEIRIRGVLGATLRTAFQAMRATPTDGDTLLSGRLPDQVALHGILRQIDSLGLDLLAIRRLG